MNVTSQLACGSNTATLSWDTSAGAVGYVSTLTGPDGNQLSCNVANTTCSISDLACGQTYAVMVTAVGETCINVVNATAQIQTAPCASLNVKTLVDCGSNAATLFWDDAPGAVNYIATVTGPARDKHTCNTTETSCSLQELQCGHSYSVTVLALGEQCSSTASAATKLLTAPCTPRNVTTWIDCGTNTAILSWDNSPGATSYISTVTGANGEQLSCNSTDTVCEVSSLQCGQTYSVAVVAFGNNCSSAASAPTELKTAPCIPTNVETQLECRANIATISWYNAKGAASYFSAVTGPDGEQLFCNATDTACDVADLQCGQAYNATVTAINDLCSSAASAAATMQTVPCVPQSLDVLLDCGTDIATLSWSAADGAISYTSTVTGPNGEEQGCNTTDTTCNIAGLQCGQRYNATIIAFGDQCASGVSAAAEFQTAPCVPKNVEAQIDCDTNTATLLWERASGAVSYSSSVTGPRGEQHSCNATETTCNITALQCGQTYNASVIALSDQCSSAASATTEFQTAPCLPGNVGTQIDCETNTATLSWDGAAGAVSYTSILSGPNGELHSCNASEKDVSCSTEVLPCGQMYVVSVAAFGENCSSMASAAVELKTAPCIPRNVLTLLNCRTNVATLSWEDAPGAVNYVSTVTSPDGEQHSYNSTEATCDVSDLECGQTYAVTIRALDDQCSSADSATANLQMGKDSASVLQEL
ncbi:fibronectin type III domain-containing protein 7-like [Rhinatrema bivittatum]|uniref:fibronectin type III domain-containing protein 7-like n=1 Tax=Rhinatrema bivittatum TaxID=194408 RepID=UPI00112ED887|nr:fibronectin type III domain-containing protein 7-like [Rhinatrema bivittatum]